MKQETGTRQESAAIRETVRQMLVDHGKAVWADAEQACARCAEDERLRAENKRLNAEWDVAFADLRAAGPESDADDPAAARYRAASDAVNHSNRKMFRHI